MKLQWETQEEFQRDLAFHLVSIHGDAEAFTRSPGWNGVVHLKMHHGPDWPDVSYNERLLERILEDYEKEHNEVIQGVSAESTGRIHGEGNH